MAAIIFKTKPYKIGTWTVVQLPKKASNKLPSRGMNFAEGVINSSRLQIPLEPDGKGSHWFRVDSNMAKEAQITSGKAASFNLEPLKEWPDPKMPSDVRSALKKSVKAQTTWKETTSKARWEWLRWIRATSNPDTRDKRIKMGISKLSKGMKRPCCFNASMCTEPKVSKGGVLIEPTK